MTMFILASGSILVSALAEKVAEEYGFNYVGTALKIVLPIVAVATGAYFLKTNAIMAWWLR
ncbi:hypothetical protein [Bacillus sp. JJ722]|uniref:hypothetical protein n=1 Tax=Bacillus sp. JJ722 TaxID=3122973 RepID=UPI0030000BE2